MTFLPIVDRELRAAARRRGTYAVRLLVALIAMLTGCVVFLINLGASQQAIGRYIFAGLAILCLIYCLASGRISTADCLSEEKREGTLGLLFLTDLKGYDVVLGKLVATSLNALYGLLAVLPVLALPLLLGGTTNGEFWRVVLVLLNTFLFSLAIGIFGSALTRDARQAMAANFGLVILLMAALPFACVLFIHYAWGIDQPAAFVSCPIFSFYLCEDSHYKAHAIHFWWSAAVIHGLTWLLLVMASWLAPRSWQDKPAPRVRTPKATWRALWRAWSYGKPAKLPGYRRRLLNVNAFYWLTARARLKPVQVWTFLGLFSGWWIWIWLKSHVAWFDPIMATTPAIILNSTIKAWIALEAAQQLAEDRKAGALELLLSTPLNVRDILRGQYLALRRQFFKPLLLMIAVELIFMTAQARHAASAERNQISSFWAAGIVMLMADVMTLPMVAMRVSLTAKSPNRASVSTISRVLILPWFLFGIGAAIADLWTGLFSDAGEMPGWKTLLGLWFGTGMVVDLCFGLTAWWQLLHKFRELANRELARGARGLAGPQIVAAKLATRPAGMAPEPEPSLAPRLSRRKRALLYGSALIALLGGVFVTHWRAEGNLPSPLLVSITRSNAPLRVFSGGAFDMILPDGSLWRWGATSGSVPVQSWPVAPGQLGTNCDWLQVSSMGNRNVGLSKDGTLWQWWSMGLVPTSVSGRGRDQLDEAHDWISASTSWEHSVALKQNGTLWAWGENTSGQLGNGPGPNQNGPVQVGTNSDWVAVTCVGTATFGLRANGTLWIWGRAWNYSQGGLPVVFPAPVQFCQETNWTAVGAGFGFLAWTSSGEVWRPNPGSANAQAPASATCEFISSNAQPDRLAITRWQAPKLYEARRDGTLWERNCSFPGRPVPVDVTWRRVGKRTDWVAIWGNGATAVGLTADNTIWTWGIDPTREAILSFVGRVQRLNYRMNELFGTRRPPTPMMFGGPGFKRPAVRITPRALMRMAISTAKPTNGATMFRSEER